MKFVGLDGLKHFWSKAKIWIIDRITTEVTAKIAEIVANAPEDLDTLKEIADWISSHANDAAAMNAEIKANTEAISGKADKNHTHIKSDITDFPTSLPANGGTADYANKIEPNYISKTLTTVTSVTTKYIKVADCTWNQTGTLQVHLFGNNFEDTLVINFGGGNSLSPTLCGNYNSNSHGVYSVIVQKGSTWGSNYSIYVKVRQLTDCNVGVALLKGGCTINITESTTAPTNISEWAVSDGFFGTLTGNAKTATSASKLTTARKTYVTLGTASTTTTRDWSGDTTIPVSGVLPVANGGTGQTTANAAANSFINSLTVGTDVPVDDDYYVCQSAGGGTTTNTYHRRPVSKLWEYIKSKISSVLGLTATNYGGKASTAGTADKTVNDITINIPFVQESGQYVIPLGNILEPTSTAIDSPYNWDITGFFSIIRPSGHNGSHIQFEAGHGYSHDWSTYAYLDKMEFRGVTASIKAFQYKGKWWLGLCIYAPNQGYTSKMTITYSRGLPATPTCILYNSKSNGVANEEIYNSIQDIPSSWWRQRTICNPTTFSDTLYANGVITPRKGTIDGATVSIGRSDGNITIGDINNKNSGYTTINNDCKMLKSLDVSGDALSSFKGSCDFGDISVQGKSLFPSGYIPRTYYMQGKNLNTLTTADKALLKKLFAFMIFNRVSALNFTLSYKINNTDSNKFINAIGYGYTDYEGIIDIDNNDNITFSSDFFYNDCNLIGDNGDEGAYKVLDAYDLAGRLLKDDLANLTYLNFYGTFTLLEKL